MPLLADGGGLGRMDVVLTFLLEERGGLACLEFLSHNPYFRKGTEDCDNEGMRYRY